MKPLPSVLAAPWAIEERALRVIFGVWSRGQIDAAALAQAKADWQAREDSRPKAEEPGGVEGTGGTLRILGDVGVLAIEGPLFRHANLISDFSGGTTYDAIWRGLEAALSSNAVKSILLRVNSPGGEADGVNELAKFIAAASERKPVWAYAEGMMASAAYWLGSQAVHLVAEETSEIGSIGVRSGLVDDSARDEMAGIREIEIISSVSPGKRSSPVDDEVIGRLQVRIDDLAEIFVGAVARGRGVKPAVVLSDFGRGDVLIADKARTAGMVDAIGDFNETLAALSAAGASPTRSTARAARATGATAMAIEQRPETKAAEQSGHPPWSCKGCNQEMGGNADAFCAHCMEGEHEEPDGDEGDEDSTSGDASAHALKAAGLLGEKRSETRIRLAAFARSVLKISGEATADAALGVLKASMEARAELETVRAAAITAAGDKAKADVLGALSAALKGAKISLAAAAGITDFMGDDAEADKVRTALSASMPDPRDPKKTIAVPQTAETILGAFASAKYTAKDASRISAYLGAKGATLPAAHREAPDDTKNRDAVAAQNAGARVAFSIDDIRAAQTKPAAPTKENLR